MRQADGGPGHGVEGGAARRFPRSAWTMALALAAACGGSKGQGGDGSGADQPGGNGDAGGTDRPGDGGEGGGAADAVDRAGDGGSACPDPAFLTPERRVRWAPGIPGGI